MNRKKAGTVRIIGGKWRGRRLPVPDLPGLRPTGDRGRETLFNWLAPHLHGARCADLFAGTGALGFEALSRGAASVVLVEKAGAAARSIRESMAVFADRTDVRAEFVRGDALDWIENCPQQSLDIVFIDPPFGSGLEIRALEALAEGNCLVEGGLVYLEQPRQAAVFVPGPAWETFREKTVGEVFMRLLKKV